ncbi:DUF1499 domain-containing protein [Rubritalea tangerina]|uniref:DUF1499 domain-containing protein n=1 Tax=Rubritalea tangerina TaxID=430798 RepID=A0ABW4ZEV4_9BACT
MSSWLEWFAVMLGGGALSLKCLAVWSQTRSAAHGLIHGRLAPNNASPNSVCSEGEAANIAPLKLSGPDTWEDLQDAIESLSGRLITVESHYLHAVFKTPIWGFEDDLEARLDTETGHIQLRSSSRVGYSDTGTNARRVESLRALLE